MRPLPADYPPYYHSYIGLVTQDAVMQALLAARNEALSLSRTVSEERENYAYADGKWTVKEVFLHCADTERVFSCRALAFARGEKQKMLPFEENEYAANSYAAERTLAGIMAEYEAVSAATQALFATFSPQVLAAAGETPSGRATVNSLGFMISGHLQHHLNVLRDRYLK